MAMKHEPAQNPSSAYHGRPKTFAVTKLPDTADLAIVDVADLIHRGTGLRDIAD
jgi:hypothetical protein